MERPINEMLKIAMDSLKEITDVNIIVGDKITVGEMAVIPISKVKCGYISGGIDQKKKITRANMEPDEILPFGGASGGTVSITPVAFLAFVNNDVKVLHLEETSHAFEKLIDFVPETINMIIRNFKKDKKSNIYTIETK